MCHNQVLVFALRPSNLVKLIVTIIDDQDADPVITALTHQHFRVTRVSSTGGLVSPGKSTLLMGVDDDQVSQVSQTLRETAARHSMAWPYAYAEAAPLYSMVEVEVGGFLSFVLDIDHFEQV